MGGVDLRKLGWLDYLSSETHAAQDEAHALFDAFVYISLEDTDDWNNTMPIVRGLLATISTCRKTSMPQADMEWLHKTLLKNPVDRLELERWFVHVMRPDVLK